MFYIASPYSSPDPAVRAERFMAVCRAAALMMKQGMHVYSPIIHSHPIALIGDLPKGWDYWREYDEFFIKHCDGVIVLMLDGWKESIGIKAELELAEKYGKPVRYMEVKDALVAFYEEVFGK